MECEGIGAERAESIVEWFADPDNRRLLDELRELGLRFRADEGDLPREGPLSGRQYVLTGTFESLSREEATAALEQLGAKVSGSVSRRTSAVIVGQRPGTKAAKAEALGVPLLGEEELAALLAEPAATGKQGESEPGS